MKSIATITFLCITLGSYAQTDQSKSLSDTLPPQHIFSEKILNEITIISKKPTIQIGDDKKIFAVNQSLVSIGGNATDLLRNIPTLQIDVEGKVNLRGSNNVKIFVDGKPSLIAGGTVQQVLQSIPASAIENVELITNPSSKYSADGQAIINIVLKKNKKAGFNGSAALTLGTRRNYNAGGSLSFKTGKVNVYTDYTFQQLKTYSNGFQYMTFRKAGEVTGFSNETFPSTTRTPGNNAKAGADFSLTDKTTISLSAGINANHVYRNEFLNIDQLNASGSPAQKLNCYNLSSGTNRSQNLNLDFSQRFRKPEEELTLNFNYSTGTIRNAQTFNSVITSLLDLEPDTTHTSIQNRIWRKSRNYNIQADYVLPVGHAGKIEAGYQGQIGMSDDSQYLFSRDQRSKKYSPDYRFTNFLEADNQVHALYLSYKNQIRNFSYQVGLRAEDADLTARTAGYDSNWVLLPKPVRVANRGIYPSVFLTQKLSGEQQFRLSYFRRVTRPNPREINTFPDISDPVNYEVGNPGILPQRNHSVELGYGKNWENVSLTASLYYNRFDHLIKRIQTDPVDGVTITTSRNMKRAVNTGLEVISHFSFFKAWDFTANANIYHRENSAAPEFGVRETRSLSWNANITNNFNLVKGLSVQIRLDYRAADLIFQDASRRAFGTDAAARYDFPNKKSSISFTARDIFYSRQWAFLRASDTILLDFRRMSQSSRASLTYSYRFGRNASESKKSKKAEVTDKRIDERP